MSERERTAQAVGGMFIAFAVLVALVAGCDGWREEDEPCETFEVTAAVLGPPPPRPAPPRPAPPVRQAPAPQAPARKAPSLEKTAPRPPVKQPAAPAPAAPRFDDHGPAVVHPTASPSPTKAKKKRHRVDVDLCDD
ncbi:hypothetical protein ACFWVB_02690 [Streptomyces microflavus]|uniref:hypothetical protein n=1 Tax=Streptomyces microflavus TaxID=1919 RepID=UPI00366014F2